MLCTVLFPPSENFGRNRERHGKNDKKKIIAAD